MNADINIIYSGLGIMVTLVGLGWKIGIILGDIRSSIVRIETSLISATHRLDRVERDVETLKVDTTNLNIAMQRNHH